MRTATAPTVPTTPASATAPTIPVTAAIPTTPTAATSVLGTAPHFDELRALLRAAAAVVATIDLRDPAWGEVGRRLTAVVNIARRIAASVTSIEREPIIGEDDDVAPVLRLRDLAHLQRRLEGVDGTARPGDDGARLRTAVRRLSVSALEVHAGGTR